MKFSEGDQVLAKIPTSDEYQKGKIVNIRGSKYKVQFKGGVEHTVSEADVRVSHLSTRLCVCRDVKWASVTDLRAFVHCSGREILEESDKIERQAAG